MAMARLLFPHGCPPLTLGVPGALPASADPLSVLLSGESGSGETLSLRDELSAVSEPPCLVTPGWRKEG